MVKMSAESAPPGQLQSSHCSSAIKSTSLQACSAGRRVRIAQRTQQHDSFFYATFPTYMTNSCQIDCLQLESAGFSNFFLDSTNFKILTDYVLKFLQTIRQVSIILSQMWDGQGLLGVSIRFFSCEGANENVWHILVNTDSSNDNLFHMIWKYIDWFSHERISNRTHQLTSAHSDCM